MAEPIVSVITATYNRSNVLRYTIGSVQRSRLTAWEQIIVGDACSDDTEAVVASFGDPRLRFYNLTRNFGEQSGPNNVGSTYARGRYLAFLNHDDLIFPEHLELAVATLEGGDADLVFTQGIGIYGDGSSLLLGVAPGGRYAPHCFVPASLWVLRRELLTQVGLWRPARESFAVPSQAWLWRAYKAGARLRGIPQVTALVVPSGFRPGAYMRRDAEEHARLYRRLCDEPGFRERMLEQLARDQAERLADLSLPAALRRLARAIVYNAARVLDMPPAGLTGALRFRRRGGQIAHLRRVRGLPTR